MLYSQIKGKKVYSIDNAEFLGKVESVLINKATKRPHFIALEGQVYVELSDIYGVNDFLTVKSFSRQNVESSDYIFYHDDIAIMDVEGKALGEKSELKLKKARLCINDVEIPLTRMVSGSEQIIIVNPKGKRLNAARKAKAASAEKRLYEPLTMTGMDTPLSGELSLNLDNGLSLIRGGSDYSFLLGRRVVKDITDLSGTLFIKDGTVIGESEIEEAKRAGKLVDLTINSLK